MNRRLLSAGLLLIVAVFSGLVSSGIGEDATGNSESAKNVILLIGDGMGWDFLN
jgi:alkaline phosphatase